MNESGATAVTFILLSWTLIWWVAFELWPELRAAKLRLRLRRMQMEMGGREPSEFCGAAAERAEEFRWLPMLLAPESEPASADDERAAWEIVRHAAWSAPWMWPWLGTEAGRRRWIRRAWGLAKKLAAGRGPGHPADRSAR